MGVLRAPGVALAGVALAACSPGVVDAPPWGQAPARAYAPLSVIDVQLGTAPRAPSGREITVAVVTQGSAERARIDCRLRRGDEVVASATTEFAPAGTSSTEFRLWTEGGFAPGAYRLDVELDGRAAAARDLRMDER